MRKLLIALIGITLFSCDDFFERDVDLDIPDHDPKLVMYSYATPGDSLIILLTTSIGVEIPANLWEMWMSNADIEVIKNGVESIPVHVNTTNDTFPFFVAVTDLNENDHLSITVAAEGYESISSEVVIPTQPVVSNAEYTGRRINSEGDEFAAFKFDIIDEKDVDSYYEVIVVSVWTDEVTGEQYANPAAYRYDSNLPWINPPSDGGFTIRLFFEDGAFENDEGTVEFLADVWELANPEFYDPEFASDYYLSIRSVSSDYYDFVNAYGIHQENQFPDLFSGEPVPLPSNIENGFGVFGAFSEIRIPIDLGELDGN